MGGASQRQLLSRPLCRCTAVPFLLHTQCDLLKTQVRPWVLSGSATIGLWQHCRPLLLPGPGLPRLVLHLADAPAGQSWCLFCGASALWLVPGEMRGLQKQPNSLGWRKVGECPPCAPHLGRAWAGGLCYFRTALCVPTLWQAQAQTSMERRHGAREGCQPSVPDTLGPGRLGRCPGLVSRTGLGGPGSLWSAE